MSLDHWSSRVARMRCRMTVAGLLGVALVCGFSIRAHGRQISVRVDTSAIELTTSSEFPHASARAVPEAWLKSLLDTSDMSSVAEEARLTYQQWRQDGVPESEWREHFLCTRIPGSFFEDALFIVQPGRDPSPSQFHGAHASRFWVVLANDTISKVFVNVVVDAIDVHISADGSPPILTLVWMYANRVEELDLRYDQKTNAYIMNSR